MRAFRETGRDSAVACLKKCGVVATTVLSILVSAGTGVASATAGTDAVVGSERPGPSVTGGTAYQDGTMRHSGFSPAYLKKPRKVTVADQQNMIAWEDMRQIIDLLTVLFGGGSQSISWNAPVGRSPSLRALTERVRSDDDKVDVFADITLGVTIRVRPAGSSGAPLLP